MQQGVTVKKQSPSILMLISLYSPNGSYDANFLINYCGINLRDQLLRIPGIAQVDLFGGTDYGMRIWLRPDRMAKLGLTPSDVINAIKEQNLQAPAGRVGMRPSPKDQEFTYTVSAPGRLINEDEFANIIKEWRRRPDPGEMWSVERVTGLQLFGRLDGRPRARWPSTSRPGPTSSRPRRDYETMHTAKTSSCPWTPDRLRHDPGRRGLDRVHRPHLRGGGHPRHAGGVHLPRTSAPRSFSLIVPVSLIGTFIFFPILGFSVNTLSMFGLVLAISWWTTRSSSWKR